MSKPALVVAAAVLTVLGSVATTKSLMPSTSAAAMHDSLLATTRVASRVAPSEMIAIVPAPVIETNAQVFIGTGDGSGGAWVKP